MPAIRHRLRVEPGRSISVAALTLGPVSPRWVSVATAFATAITASSRDPRSVAAFRGLRKTRGGSLLLFQGGIRRGIVEFLKLVTSTFYANQVKQKNILFICSRLGSTLKVHVFDERTQVFLAGGPHLCT